MLPTGSEVPEANDEVHTLLEHYGFTVPLGHLRQAINAHGRGEWASANSQMRSFLEGLLDEIAERLAPERAATTSGGPGRRALLAHLDPPFLSVALNEWRDDPRAGFFNGFFNRLHPERSHRVPSAEENSTYRPPLVFNLASCLMIP